MEPSLVDTLRQWFVNTYGVFTNSIDFGRKENIEDLPKINGFSH